MYAGADSPGINYPGGPLGGIGNLFSFLGFRDSDDPADALRNILIKYIVLLKNYRVKASSKGIIYTHRVKMPEMDEIYKRTPMRWTSRSWIKAVEFGVSGLNIVPTGYRQSAGPLLENDSATTYLWTSTLSENHLGDREIYFQNTDRHHEILQI